MALPPKNLVGPDAGDSRQPTGYLTYDEFLATTPEGIRAEWVDGAVFVMEPASAEHQDIVLFLSALLRYFVEARGSGRVLVSPFQMKTGRDLPGREPDLLLVANANVHRLRKNFLDGPADLAVEVVSPDSRKRDRVEKLGEYERGGVREYWLIDPPRKSAMFYQLGDDGRYTLSPLDPAGRYRSAVLDGLWFDPEWLWQDPLPRLATVLREWQLI